MKELHLTRRELLASGGAAAIAAPAGIHAAPATAGPVAPNWDSLAAHYRVPDWFRDAKFGIWAHWGPQCQPEWGDWYARLLYMTDRPPWMKGETAYEHHLKHYGHPSRTGFLDIIGQWKAENWRPEELLARYRAHGFSARDFDGEQFVRLRTLRHRLDRMTEEPQRKTA